MPRSCFVIMPFSTSASCTGEQWTWIFEKLFKPSVESAGLDYECRRSVATRRNIVAAIVQDLNDAYVVLADLTDRNANVFYELGSTSLCQLVASLRMRLQSLSRVIASFKSGNCWVP